MMNSRVIVSVGTDLAYMVNMYTPEGKMKDEPVKYHDSLTRDDAKPFHCAHNKRDEEQKSEYDEVSPEQVVDFIKRVNEMIGVDFDIDRLTGNIGLDDPSALFYPELIDESNFEVHLFGGCPPEIATGILAKVKEDGHRITKIKGRTPVDA